MSLKEASSFRHSLSIPGKVFLLGEYAALCGLPALIATVPPRFNLKISDSPAAPSTFHPSSPMGLLLEWVKRKDPTREFHLVFEDPHQGSGGFGASTAQFGMALKALYPDWDWKAAWDLYRELTQGENLPPSGADLVAQWLGGIVYFERFKKAATQLNQSFDWSHLLVFSATRQAPRKVATHEHLSHVSSHNLLNPDGALPQRLARITAQGLAGIEDQNPTQLGQALDTYAETLLEANLEIPETTADRKHLRSLPGVVGVKGAGALQADAILILLDPKCPERSRVISEAEKRGLVLIANGVALEAGLQSSPQKGITEEVITEEVVTEEVVTEERINGED